MFTKLYLIALTVFLIIDILWLTVIAKNLYQNQIGTLMKDNINYISAIIFYLLFIIGLVVFVISPAVENESWTHALIYGALFGLITYATYDLTNLATLKDWPINVTIIDLIWGMTISSAVSVITYFIASNLSL